MKERCKNEASTIPPSKKARGIAPLVTRSYTACINVLHSSSCSGVGVGVTLLQVMPSLWSTELIKKLPAGPKPSSPLSSCMTSGVQQHDQCVASCPYPHPHLTNQLFLVVQGDELILKPLLIRSLGCAGQKLDVLYRLVHASDLLFIIFQWDLNWNELNWIELNWRSTVLVRESDLGVHPNWKGTQRGNEMKGKVGVPQRTSPKHTHGRTRKPNIGSRCRSWFWFALPWFGFALVGWSTCHVTWHLKILQ